MKRTRFLFVSVEDFDTFSFWEHKSKDYELAGWSVVLLWVGLPYEAPTGVHQPLTSLEVEKVVKRGLLLLGWPILELNLLARIRSCLDFWNEFSPDTDIFLVDGEAPEIIVNQEPDQWIEHDLIGISAPIFLDDTTGRVHVNFGRNRLLSVPPPMSVLSFRPSAENRARLGSIAEYIMSSPANDIRVMFGSPTIQFVGWPREYRPALLRSDSRPAVLDLNGWDWTRGVFFSHLERPVNANQPEYLRYLTSLADDGHPRRALLLSDWESGPKPRRRPLMFSELSEDSAISAVIQAAILAGDGWRVPDPIFDSSTNFYEWMSTPATKHDWMPRYWRAVVNSRPDLRREFADLESGDRERFLGWTRNRTWVENVPISPVIKESILVQQLWVKGEQNSVNGRDHNYWSGRSIDVSGYLDRQSSLGQIARKILSVARLRLNAIHVTLYGRTQSPKIDVGDLLLPVDDQEMEISASIQVINADQLGFFIQDHATTRNAHLRIGYWFWELEDAPPSSEMFVDELDEVWTASEFVRASVAKEFGERARLVPVPVGRPELSGRSRRDFGLPSEGFMFLTTFDFYSCSERKNPEGSVRAFLSAFPEASTSQFLVIKSLHGEQMWPEMANLKQLAQDRPDIIFMDVSLSDEDQNSLLAESDCLVSLHRSEGFGLHLAQAMYLGTPVIATAYSANLDFMDDSSALLVPYSFCSPTSRQSIYSESSKWADPDIQTAAEYMRLVASDVATQSRLAVAGEEMISAYDASAYVKLVENIDRIAGQQVIKDA